ncbi:hypothetical protein, partial [Streptococcus pneumoniae]|uniref:hypothetical protein n=1 Tax=Streptococcus pneumoniae TaxID=1313 RepID=UPI001C71968E
IGLTTTLKNAWTTSRQVNFFWVANFNLKFGKLSDIGIAHILSMYSIQNYFRSYIPNLKSV